MKIVFLETAEDFCREHNFQTISIKQLRDIAVDNKKESGAEIAFKSGYAHAMNKLTEFLGANRP